MRLTSMSAFAMLLPATLIAQETVEFADHTWSTAGTVRVEPHMGRSALRMRGGRALLEGLDFTNGTIEFDIAVTGHRSFVGLTFRRSTPAGQAESFYLRPHQSGRFDAVQYTPVENGISAWQLFPEGNAETIIPANEWIPVRLEVAGYELSVFVGDGKEPVLNARLATDRTSGPIALNSGVPGGTGGISAPPDILTTAFSNFRVTPNTNPVPMAEYEAPDARFISNWAVSPAVPAPEEPPTTLPRNLMQPDRWVDAATDYSGRVNLARYRAIPEDADRGMVLVRSIVTSERAQHKRLGIGFSDVGSVFVNGRLVYSANNSYMSRSGRYLGVMTVNDVIDVSLEEGQNDIVVAVIENFGGWGVMARWEDREGIE